MKTLRQILAIVLMNLRSLPDRLGLSLVIVIGIAGVVGVLVALLSMSAGLERTLAATGRSDRVVVTRGGSNGELASFLPVAATTLIRQDRAIARGGDGLPLASAEMIVITEVPRKGQRSGANVSFRGVEPTGFAIRPELRLLEGRRFRPGLREVIVGRALAQQFDGLGVGQQLRVRGSQWQIVGVFESGDAHDSEIWTDVDTAQSAFNRSGWYSSLLLQLANTDSFDALAARLGSDPQLNVEAKREIDFFSGQSRGLTATIGVLAGIVALIMAIGATFGALNTMYSAVAARTREIGTLRALGFGALPVVASVMAEALLLALLGGGLGAGLAWLLFNGYAVSTLGSGFTQVAFQFAVTPALLLQGLALALAIGCIGGLAPAWRAARLPVTAALRG